MGHLLYITKIVNGDHTHTHIYTNIYECRFIYRGKDKRLALNTSKIDVDINI